MSDRFHVPHIKRHTEGTSNELSFDVLDAASNELDGKKKGLFGRKRGMKSPETVKPAKAKKDAKGSSASTASALPIPSSAPAVAQAAPKATTHPNLSPADEIDQRKRTRRARAWRIRILVGIIVVGLITAGALATYKYFKQREDYASMFTQMVSEFIETDRTLVTVDGLMGNPMSVESAELRAQTLESFDSVKAVLNHVHESVVDLKPAAGDERDRSALEKVDEAASGRVAMLAAAKDTFELSAEALERINEASRIWQNVMSADAKARAAANAANAAADENATRTAYDMTSEAQEAFEETLNDLDDLQYELGEQVNLSAHRAYLEKRIEALEYAKATANSLLDGNREAATANNDAYNRAEQEAARMAEALPFLLEDPIRTAFEKALEPHIESYDTARQDVSAADAIIRDYLGERGK